MICWRLLKSVTWEKYKESDQQLQRGHSVSTSVAVKRNGLWQSAIYTLSSGDLHQCFPTFWLQRNLPQMFALLMEPYAMIEVSILLQPHRTVFTDFVPGAISVCFGGTTGSQLRNPGVPRNPGWKTLTQTKRCHWSWTTDFVRMFSFVQVLSIAVLVQLPTNFWAIPPSETITCVSSIWPRPAADLTRLISAVRAKVEKWTYCKRFTCDNKKNLKYYPPGQLECFQERLFLRQRICSGLSFGERCSPQSCVLEPNLLGIVFSAVLHHPFHDDGENSIRDRVFPRSRRNGWLKLARLRAITKPQQIFVSELLFAHAVAFVSCSQAGLQLPMDLFADSCWAFFSGHQQKMIVAMHQSMSTAASSQANIIVTRRSRQHLLCLSSYMSNNCFLENEIQSRIGKTSTRFSCEAWAYRS